MAYDEKYKKRAVEYRKEVYTIEETAKTFKICTTTLKAWVKQYDETGNFKKKIIVRKHKKIDPGKLETYIEEHPDAYLTEIANTRKDKLVYIDETGIDPSYIETIVEPRGERRWLVRLGAKSLSEQGLSRLK